LAAQPAAFTIAVSRLRSSIAKKKPEARIQKQQRGSQGQGEA
jgi:hypothetical protein